MFSTLFTAWGYEVSYLEFIASLVSFIGVALGITRKRITWPWWAASSVLYGIFFLQYELYASAALQLIFIAAAIIGWFGWEPTGAKPGPVKNSYRIYILAAILVSTLALGPVLKSLGAASTYVDAILFFGSFAAQMLMVYQKYETWPLWLVVDAGYVALYASQGLLFTTLLYVLFTIMAVLGWISWYGAHRRAIRSL
ncbi:MAG: nicotinamide mononucleotide transporter [Candidatus Planktophila sp.]|nr:nicotinamide mononucleotide transporter [Candidatus Planktophila sp.]MSO25172.1 nicotinamide mononucleotide transporter [Candidatus Planktophila sp.]